MAFLGNVFSNKVRKNWLYTAKRFFVSVLVSFLILGSVPVPVLAFVVSGGDDAGEVSLEIPVVSGSAGEEDSVSIDTEVVSVANSPAEELVFSPIISADSGEEITSISVDATEDENLISVPISGNAGEEIVTQSEPEVVPLANSSADEPVSSPVVSVDEGETIPAVSVVADESETIPAVSVVADEGETISDAPISSGNAGEEIVTQSEPEVVPLANSSADEIVSTPAVVADSGETIEHVSVSADAGEDAYSVATFGDEGVAIALPISPLVVSGSAGEDASQTLGVVTGSAGEDASPMLAVSGDAGEQIEAPLAVSASAGEEDTHPAIVVSGDAGEGSVEQVIVVSGSAGEEDTHPAIVVSGDAGEGSVEQVIVVSGSAGEGDGFSFVSGDAGEEAPLTDVPAVVGNAGETPDMDTPPLVSGSAGEDPLVVANPPVVVGNTGETPGAVISPVVEGNAGEVDLCSNIEQTQITVPVGYVANGDGTCTQESTNNGGSGVTDLCSNIADVQATIPSGYVGNADGTCTESVVAVVDVCSNIAGAQATVPSGYTASGGVCTEPVVPPVDVCSNVAGDQVTLPSGYTQNTDGTCTQQDTGGGSTTIDLCSNIADVQATIPTGYTANADGTCQQNTGNGGGGSTTGGNTGGNSGGSVVQSGGGGGGGGGSGSSFFGIYNEAVVELSPGVVAVRWTTNHPGISRVVFGTTSVATLATTSPFLGYERGVIVTTSPTTNHVAIIEGLEVGVPYFFRALSTRDGYKEISGKELSFVVTGIATITEAKDQCPFLSSYLQRGGTNDIEQIVRLQAFLKLHEELPVVISGTYDLATEQAVHAFQNKYADEVLLPWGKDVSSTGYVYITTKWKINQLICGGAELTTGEQSVIQSYQTRPDLVGVGGSVSAPIRGQESELIAVPETTASTTIPAPFIIGAEEGTNDQLASVFRANDTQCTFDTEDSFLFDTVLFLPRLVYCVLHPLVGAK